jgi:hypothetical protein
LISTGRAAATVEKVGAERAVAHNPESTHIAENMLKGPSEVFNNIRREEVGNIK